MTERRRPLDNDDGQESLFGGEAFAAGPPAPTPWEREHAVRSESRADAGHEATAHLPLDAAEAFEARVDVRDDAAIASPADTAETPAVEAGEAYAAGADVAVPDAAVPGGTEDEWAPLDEGQYLTGHEAGPSAADLAAYDFEVGTAPTEVPAHDAGEELAALERATVVPGSARGSRATLAGPTLDDVMSRAWEGLVTGLPAACPVCDGEVVPSFAGSVHGGCSSCGTTIE